MRATIVVKVGGSLLPRLEDLDAVLAEIAAAGRETRLLVVPGGGPFADHVRDLERRIGLTDEAAHWMAILAMNQYAHLIVARMIGARLVHSSREIASALDAGQVPVLAPYQWMRETDPLPHSWDITSDSISAWVAGQVGASRLVVVKAPGASGSDLVDPCFARVLPPAVDQAIVTADRIDLLRAALAVP